MGQEATVRTVHGTTEWFKIGKVAICMPPTLLIAGNAQGHDLTQERTSHEEDLGLEEGDHVSQSF